jgi:hypothetical protein
MFPDLPRPTFSGHETFPLRYAWLKKAHDSVAKDPEIFYAEDALVRLGVGKNMVKAIRHWGMATGVLAEGASLASSRLKAVEVSPLGKKLFGARGYDPYLEDPATLWVLHWQLASTPERSTTWYWLFNHQPTPDFTVEAAVSSLRRLADERGWPKITPASLKRDVDCCVRTYCATRKSKRTVLEDTLDCPLAELGLVLPTTNRETYLLTREQRPSLSTPIFAFALADYLVRSPEPIGTLLLDDLMHQPGAPGRVLRVIEEELQAHVEALEELTDGAVVYDETAGLKQIRIRGKLNPMKLLRMHYHQPRKTGGRV